MRHSAGRLGFWFVKSAPGFDVPPSGTYYFFSSGQIPGNLEANTRLDVNFYANGSISGFADQVEQGGLQEQLPNFWNQNGQPGSNYEIRATVDTTDTVGTGHVYQIFGGANNTPTTGNSTAWFNLGNTATFTVRLGSTVGTFDYRSLEVLIEIGAAGTSTALFSDTFIIDIGAV